MTGVGALLLPLSARAADGTPVVVRFSSAGAVSSIAMALVLVGFFINRYVPHKRRRMREPAIAALLCFATFGIAEVLSLLAYSGPSQIAREFSEFFGIISVVNLGTLVVFDLGLSAAGIASAPFLASLVGVIGNVAALVFTLRHLGVEFSGLLATSALLTTITAFSLQGTLSNIVGGLALQIDESIRVGDWVQLENGRQGRVREIRWRYTVIETRDWDTMIVPNSTILSGTVTILGKRDGQPLQHRMWVFFDVDFSHSPTDVIEAVNKGLQIAAIEGVASEPKPHAICMDLAKEHPGGCARYAVRYWLTDIARDDPTSSRVRERIYTALKRASIPLALPLGKFLVEHDDVHRRDQEQLQEHERRMAALESVEFLRSLHTEEREHIAKRLRYALFAPGESITRQGAVAHWLYILIDGVSEVRLDINGVETAVTQVQAPSFVGEMGLLTGAPRTATVVALTEVECYRLDKEAFNKILADRPEIAAEISPMLARRAVELSALKEHLDATAKQRGLEAERRRILGTIQRFFGLIDEDGKPRSRSQMPG